MKSSADVRKHFDGPFGPPVTQQQFDSAERSLCHELPAPLKEHYAQYDGFKGPTETNFLYPLEELVRTTLWLRGEGYFPDFLNHSVALGEDGTGAYWVIDINRPNKVLEWDAEMEGDEHVVLDGTLAEEWIARQIRYENPAGT